MGEILPDSFRQAVEDAYSLKNLTHLLEDHKTDPVILIDVRLNTLVVECLKSLGKTFATNAELAPRILRSIPHFNRHLFHHVIPTDAPLAITIPNIKNDVYWKRCCMAKWPNLTYKLKEKDYKQLFAETYLSKFLENQTPGYLDYQEIKELCIILHKNILKLRIRSLKSGKKMIGTSTDCDFIADSDVPTRLDLRRVTAFLPKLVELHMSFGMENVMHVSDIRQAVLSESEIESLGEAIILSRLLTVLKITTSSFKANDFAILYHYLLESNVMAVSIENCYLNDAGAQIASLLIKNHPLLLKLSLKDNDIGSAGCFSLAHALTHQPKSKLMFIDLTMNPIGDEGGATLAAALALHPSIEEMYLSGTRLGEQSGNLFAKAIVTNHRIRNLDLSCNCFTRDNAVAFLEALNANNEIEHLDLRSCGFEYETLQDIKDILFENRETKRERIVSKRAKTKNRVLEVKRYLKNLDEDTKTEPVIFDPIPHYGSHGTSSLTLSDHGQLTLSTLDSTSSPSSTTISEQTLQVEQISHKFKRTKSLLR